MPMDYGLCCMGDDCIMWCKTLTFFYRCTTCGRFLHVPCGETDTNNCTTCKHCFHALHQNFGSEIPKKAVLEFFTNATIVCRHVTSSIDSTKKMQASPTTISQESPVALQTPRPPPSPLQRQQARRNKKEMELRLG